MKFVAGRARWNIRRARLNWPCNIVDGRVAKRLERKARVE